MATRKHQWDHAGTRRMAGVDRDDGNARNECDCLLCGLTKITIIPPHGWPWREWRTKDGAIWKGQATPPCIEAVAPVNLNEVREVEA